MNKIILFSRKSECCGCGACAVICPRNAIKLSEDPYGFLYPSIDKDLCIKCKSCLKVCAFKEDLAARND